MKCSHLSLFLSGALGYSSLACAQDYPLEFADFFELRREKVEVVIVGTIRSELVDADVSYDFFQLPQKNNTTDTLVDYFKRQRLTDAAIELILGMLSTGVVANPNCDTALSACVPKDELGKPEFVFDFDNKQLRIFLSTDMFSSFDNEAVYFSPMSEYGALINWSSLYLYADEDNYNLNWNNDTTLGLPVGYLSINTQLHQSSNGQEFNLFRAVYNYEMDDYRTIVGYQDQNAIALNSTDFLNYGADYSGVAASVGSSTNLLKGDAKAQQRLYFYATQGGQLEVYQGERLLLSQVVSAGEQSIGYDRLPVGTYQVTLRLKQAGQVVLEEQRQVVNSHAFSLPVGQWDYRFEVGRLDDEDVSVDNWWERPVEHRSYIRALSAYRPMESLLASSGLVSNGQTTQWLLGANWAPSSLVNAQYTLGFFSNGDNYQFGQLNIAPFSFSARAVTHQDLEQPSDLTRLLYGADDFREYSAGVSGEWGRGRTFINYFHYESENTRTQSSSSDNVSLTWILPLWGGDLSLNTSYSKSNASQGALYTGLSWRRRFGQDWSSQVGVNVDKSGFSYAQASATKPLSGERWHGSSTVGTKVYSDSTLLEGAMSAFGNSDYALYDAYGYVNTDGRRSLSGNISGTQIVSSQGVKATSERGLSFMALEPYWDGASTEQSAKVHYTAIKDERYWYSEAVNVGETKLVELPMYTEVDFALDVESEGIDATALDGRFFAMPGTYYRLNNEVSPLMNQVFILSDMNGEPIQLARCIGDGCKGVEELSGDGVFRVNFKRNAPFKLVSEKRQCVYNPDRMGDRYVQAYCLPGLDSLDGQLVSHDEVLTVAQALLYIGKYESTEETKQILSRLAEIGLVFKSVKVGSEQYVYVQYQEVYTTAQRTLLESLGVDVILDKINTK